MVSKPMALITEKAAYLISYYYHINFSYFQIRNFFECMAHITQLFYFYFQTFYL